MRISAAKFGQLGLDVSVDLLTNWNSSISNITSVFAWVYKTGKINATNFPMQVGYANLHSQIHIYTPTYTNPHARTHKRTHTLSLSLSLSLSRARARAFSHTYMCIYRSAEPMRCAEELSDRLTSVIYDACQKAIICIYTYVSGVYSVNTYM